MQTNYTKTQKHLTYVVRKLIERWKNNDKFSNRHIARLLSKEPQTIHNETKR